VPNYWLARGAELLRHGALISRVGLRKEVKESAVVKNVSNCRIIKTVFNVLNQNFKYGYSQLGRHFFSS